LLGDETAEMGQGTGGRYRSERKKSANEMDKPYPLGKKEYGQQKGNPFAVRKGSENTERNRQ